MYVLQMFSTSRYHMIALWFFYLSQIVLTLSSKSFYIWSNDNGNTQWYTCRRNQGKDVSVTAIQGFFYGNSIRNPFLDPGLINTTYGWSRPDIIMIIISFQWFQNIIKILINHANAKVTFCTRQWCIYRKIQW